MTTSSLTRQASPGVLLDQGPDLDEVAGAR